MGTGFACRSVSTAWAASGVSVDSGGAPARLSMNCWVVGSRLEGFLPPLLSGCIALLLVCGCEELSTRFRVDHVPSPNDHRLPTTSYRAAGCEIRLERTLAWRATAVLHRRACLGVASSGSLLAHLAAERRISRSR